MDSFPDQLAASGSSNFGEQLSAALGQRTALGTTLWSSAGEQLWGAALGSSFEEQLCTATLKNFGEQLSGVALETSFGEQV